MISSTLGGGRGSALLPKRLRIRSKSRSIKGHMRAVYVLANMSALWLDDASYHEGKVEKGGLKLNSGGWNSPGLVRIRA